MASNDGEASLTAPRFEIPTRLLIVAAPFYRAVLDDLIIGTSTAIDAAGANHELIEVPGALEVPTAIALARRTNSFDGFVALGCVIRGETTHYETVCNDSSRGLTVLGLQGVCIGNGILTVENLEQAQIRANPGGADKGGGAALAAMHLIRLARRFATDSRPLPDGSFQVAGDPDTPGRA